MTMIYDLSDPAKPVFIRNFGLPGQQPGSTGAVPADLHGWMSTGPKGNRVCSLCMVRRRVQIVDRDKLLNGPKEPTDDNLRYPQIARVDLPSSAGAHTAYPLLGKDRPEFRCQKGGKTGDFLLVPGETFGNECQETRQMPRIFDITTESKPVGISTWTVPRPAAIFAG